jgi:hypothetical protein
VAPVSRSLQPRGPDGCVQNRLRHLVRRVPPPRPLGQHNCAFYINVLETTAIWIFLACILPKSLKQRNILWRVDNTPALAYIKKEVGTCSPQVLEVAQKVLAKAHKISVRIPSEFPGKCQVLIGCFLSTASPWIDEELYRGNQQSTRIQF